MAKLTKVPPPSPYDLDASSKSRILGGHQKSKTESESPYSLRKESALAVIQSGKRKGNSEIGRPASRQRAASSVRLRAVTVHYYLERPLLG